MTDRHSAVAAVLAAQTESDAAALARRVAYGSVTAEDVRACRHADLS
jgi:hypothetical protein